MYKTTINSQSNVKTSSSNSKIGDLMIVTEEEKDRTDMVGKILLHVYNNLVNLNDPRETWAGNTGFKVRYLKPGESVTLTVGED